MPRSKKPCTSRSTTASRPSLRSTRTRRRWTSSGSGPAPTSPRSTGYFGALGIVLGLGFRDTVLVLALGNVIGVLYLRRVRADGPEDRVTQMVLSRSAFGRRGAYFPAFFQIVIATGWIAINTWIILDLSVALLERLGIPGTPATKVVVVLILMAIQVGLATLGFYAIRTFRSGPCPSPWSSSSPCPSSRGVAAKSSGATPARPQAPRAGPR